MKLSFVAPSRSLVDFPEASLPDFTVVTGVNGAGKTHFLKAILEGKLRADVALNTQQVRYYDWTTLTPKDQNAYDGQSLKKQLTQLYPQFESVRNTAKDKLIKALHDASLPQDLLLDPERLAGIPDDQLMQYVKDEDLEAVKKTIDVALTASTTTILNHYRPQPQLHDALRVFAEESGQLLVTLSRADFFSLLRVPWGHVDLFQQSFAQLFWHYNELQLENLVREAAKAKGEEDAQPLSDEEFYSKYNSPPWEFVNQVLSAAGMDFRIDRPNRFRNDSYQPQLKKVSNNVAVRFEDLSSGERILMSFALSLYYTQDKRQFSAQPNLLLLDEIDAPLHPSMVKTVLDTISRVLVAAREIKVILTTHSPTTVALADESAIYAMFPNVAGVHKQTKDQALNVLTESVPTLCIGFDGRRQVFVESETDARVYDALYSAIKKQLPAGRSLSFIPVGHRSDNGPDHNTGCAQVYRIVEDLAKAGNKTVFGLIDWDGKNHPSGRVHVLAHGVRNGLENCIYDPLLIALHVARDVKDKKNVIQLTSDETYFDLIKFPVSRLQVLVDTICCLLGTMSEEKVAQAYVGGFELQLPLAHLVIDDHELEKRVFSKIEGLSKVGSSNQRLMCHFATAGIREHPAFAPRVIQDTFEELLVFDV